MKMATQDDPTTKRIREARHRISEKCGHDPQRLVDYYIKMQKELATIQEDAAASPDQTTRGVRMAEALERLAATNAVEEIADPSEWQREQREERPLPGRSDAD